MRVNVDALNSAAVALERYPTVIRPDQVASDQPAAHSPSASAAGAVTLDEVVMTGTDIDGHSTSRADTYAHPIRPVPTSFKK